MSNTIEPITLFRYFRGELDRTRVLLQYFGFKLLTPQNEPVTLLLRVRHVAGAVAKENSVLLRRIAFDLEPLNPCVGHLAPPRVCLLHSESFRRTDVRRVTGFRQLTHS